MGVFAWSHSSPSWRTWRLEGGQCCPLEVADVVSLMLVGKMPPWDPSACLASRPGDAQGSLQKVLLWDKCEARSW